MDNKLSELSKPVAWKLHHHDRYYFEENADVVAIAESFGQAKGDAVYSQEYVSALLADRDAWQASAMALRDELRTSQAVANEYQQLMYHMDSGGDFYEFQRDKVMKEQSNG
ncbi:hypothetical protein ACSBQS_19660 [Serratia sp. H402Y]|uniref:hypothetical protein n=1 Tax=Serratia sp. H402Y TaxID=3444320 RepID=UPI003EBE4ECB